MSKKKTPQKPKRSWRDIPDSSLRTFRQLQRPASLQPGPETVEDAASGSRTARAIADAYVFRFPVTIVEVLP